MEWIAKILSKEAPVIRGAPWSFTICVVLVSALFAAGAYFITDAIYRSTIEAQNQRIEFANEQVAQYRENLKVSTPTEAAEKLTALEDRLEKEAAKNPTWTVLDHREIEQSDGSIRTEEDVFVGGGVFVPLGLKVEVRAESSILSVRFEAANFSRVEWRCAPVPARCTLDHLRMLIILHPQGRYTMVVITKNKGEISFKYSFETTEPPQIAREGPSIISKPNSAR